MTHQQFGIQFSVVSVITALGLFFLLQQPKLVEYAGFSWLSYAVFVGIAILMYIVGRKAALNENKHRFTSTVLGFTAFKMMLAIVMLVVYMKLGEPSDKLFIIPFFCIYFIYTAFEAFFMMKLTRLGV